MLSRIIVSVVLVFTAVTILTAHAVTETSACATSLDSIFPKDRTVRLLWWPDSAYRPVSHMALDVNGIVWEPFGRVTEEGLVEHHLIAARRRRGMIVLPIRVTAQELDDLENHLQSKKDKLIFRTCSGGIYDVLTRVGIMRGSSLPATFPTVMMAALIFRKLLGDDRIGTVQWIGRRSRTKISPYPLTALIGPVFEGLGAWGVLNRLDRSSPDLTHELMTRSQEAYALLMSLVQ